MSLDLTLSNKVAQALKACIKQFWPYVAIKH